MVCPKCNVSLPDGTTYCNNCSTQIAMPAQPGYNQPPAAPAQPGYAQPAPAQSAYPQQGYQQPYAPQGGAPSGLPGGLSKNAIIGIGAGVGALFLIIVIVLIVSLSGGPKIVGEWTFRTGDGVYFFWRSDHIEFHKDGTVDNYDDGTNGTWELDGDILRVRSSGSSWRFDVVIDGDRLEITDSDNDTAIFRRLK